MSDLIKVAAGPVTAIDSVNQYRLGSLQLEGGKEYRYLQADDAVVVNQAVVIDAAASSTGTKVTPSSASSDLIVGAAEVAITDEYYAWLTRRGVASVLVADGVAVGDTLAASGTAGVLDKFVARGRLIARHDFNGGGTLADGQTYAALITFGVAVTVKAITAACIGAPDDGTNTIKVKRGSSAGASMLVAASYDPVNLTANQATALSLTATTSNLAIAASGANSCIYVEFVAGTITTNPSGVSLTIEVEPTAGVQIPCGVALQANSSGSPAAKNVFLLR